MTAGVSAARPSALEAFTQVATRIDDDVRPRLRQLVVAGSRCPVAAPVVRAVIAGAKAHLERSAALSVSVAEVALAFREADRGRFEFDGMITVTDDALAAAIGPDLFRTDSAAERRGRAAGLHGVDLARYVRGAELAAAAASDGDGRWAAAVTWYANDAAVACGFFDQLGADGAVELMAGLGPTQGWWPGRSEVECAELVPVLSVLIGLACQSPRAEFAAAVATALRGAPLAARVGVAAAYASSGSLPAVVLGAMLDVVLSPTSALSLLNLGGPEGWDWGGGLDQRDALAVVLEAVDRSDTASAVLAADGTLAVRLLDPDRAYSAPAAGVLERVLDVPRVELLADGQRPDAIGAVVTLALACAEHGGTVADAAAPALARLVVAFPDEIAGAGSGAAHPLLRPALGDALAQRTGVTAGVDLVAAARQAGGEFAEKVLPGADWNPRIDAALSGFARDRFAAALSLTGPGDQLVARQLAHQAGEADMARLSSQLVRDVHEGRALDDRDALLRDIGGLVVDAATLGLDSALAAGGAEHVGEAIVGAIWAGGHADAAVADLDIAVQGAAALASIEAIAVTMPQTLPADVATLAKLSQRLPPPVHALCTARTEAARLVLAGVTFGAR